MNSNRQKLIDGIKSDILKCNKCGNFFILNERMDHE